MAQLSKEQNQKKYISPVMPLAVIFALAGGIGAAILTSPKGEKIKKNLQEAGDEVVEVLERVLNKIDSGTEHNGNGLNDFSKLFLSFVDEVKLLHSSAEESPKSALRQVEDKFKKIEKETKEELSEAALWFQKKAKSISRRNFS